MSHQTAMCDTNWEFVDGVVALETMPFEYLVVFFFNDTATTEIYTLSLHDALPIWQEL